MEFLIFRDLQVSESLPNFTVINRVIEKQSWTKKQNFNPTSITRNQLVNCNYEKKSNLSICYPLKSSGPCSKKNKKNFKKSVADPKRVYIFAPRNWDKQRFVKREKVWKSEIEWEFYERQKKFFEVLRNKETAFLRKEHNKHTRALMKIQSYYTTESLILAQDER